MIEINKKKLIFNIKEIWFSDGPFDVKGCDSVLFRACKNKLDAPGFERKEFTTLITDLSQDLEKIWNNMDKSSCRYIISRAQKEGIKIKINQNYEDFYKINKQFRGGKGLKIGITGSIDFIKKYGTLLVAEFKGEIISGCLFLEDKNNIRWLLGASKRLENKEMAKLAGDANRLLIWEAIKYAKQKGIKEFDFGGYYSGEKNEEKEKINFFKKSFGGKPAVHYMYERDYSKIFGISEKIYFLLRKKDF